MKKVILCSFTSLLAFAFIPNAAKATDAINQTELPTNSASSKTILLTGSNEIKAIEHSSLSRAEKSAMRNEIRSTDKQTHNGPGGIYISVGALIIIILLLIIFL